MIDKIQSNLSVLHSTGHPHNHRRHLKTIPLFRLKREAQIKPRGTNGTYSYACLLETHMCLFEMHICILVRLRCLYVKQMVIFVRIICLLERHICILVRLTCLLKKHIALVRLKCLLVRHRCLLARHTCLLERHICILVKIRCLHVRLRCLHVRLRCLHVRLRCLHVCHMCLLERLVVFFWGLGASLWGTCASLRGHTDTQTHKHIDIHTYIHKHTDTPTHRHTYTQTPIHTDLLLTALPPGQRGDRGAVGPLGLGAPFFPHVTARTRLVCEKFIAPNTDEPRCFLRLSILTQLHYVQGQPESQPPAACHQYQEAPGQSDPARFKVTNCRNNGPKHHFNSSSSKVSMWKFTHVSML